MRRWPVSRDSDAVVGRDREWIVNAAVAGGLDVVIDCWKREWIVNAVGKSGLESRSGPGPGTDRECGSGR